MRQFELSSLKPDQTQRERDAMAAKSAAAPKVKLAVVCASNQNRSMEAHYVLRCTPARRLGLGDDGGVGP